MNHTAELLRMAAEMLGDANPTETTLPDPRWIDVVAAGWNAVGTPETSGGAGGQLSDAATLTRAVGRSGRTMPLASAQFITWVSAQSALTETAGAVAWLRPNSTSSICSVDVHWFDSNRSILLIDDSGVFLLPPNASQIVGKKMEITGEPVTTLRFDRDDAKPLVSGPSRPRLTAVWTLLRAATLLGAAEGAYRRTREYTTVREQFGRSLDSIPAVRTALARIRIDLDIMVAAVDRASTACDTANSLIAAQIALGVCGDRAPAIADACHQLCGALGTTHEYPLHLYTRILWGTSADDYLLHHALVELGDLTLTRGEHFLWDELSTNSITTDTEFDHAS